MNWSVTNDFSSHRNRISPGILSVCEFTETLVFIQAFLFLFSPHILLGCLYLWYSTYPWRLFSCLALSWWSADAEIAIHSYMLTDSKDEIQAPDSSAHCHETGLIWCPVVISGLLLESFLLFQSTLPISSNSMSLSKKARQKGQTTHVLFLSPCPHTTTLLICWNSKYNLKISTDLHEWLPISLSISLGKWMFTDI